MNNQQIILGALSTSTGAIYTPVQLQKLLFLIDKNLSNELEGCPFFKFEPYHYGPFDKVVYQNIDKLEGEGLMQSFYTQNSNVKQFRLTKEGFKAGQSYLNELDKSISDYIDLLASYVRRLSFSELISSIYEDYPEMKENSIFQN